MEKIGTFENNYVVYQTGKKFKVVFEHEDFKVEISRLQVFEAMSEETLAFIGEFIINGKHIGSCDNGGKGACANIRCNYSNTLFMSFYKSLSTCEDYCIPKFKLSPYDIADHLACHQNIFNTVKSVKEAKATIDWLQQEADKYRKMYA